jgi:uncharacterized protein YybS (DUF2232 family)
VLSLVVVAVAMRFSHSRAMFLHLFLIGSLGPILSEVLRRNYSIEVAVISSVFAFLALGLTILLYFSIARSMTPLDLIQSYIATTVQENIEAYAQMGGPSDQIELLKNNAPALTKVFFNLLPAIVLVGTSFFVWINVLAGKFLFLKKGMWYPDFGDLSRWKIPDKYVWIVIISGIFVIVPSGVLRIVGINILIILLFFYLLQGLSIIQFYFNRKRIPMFVRVIGYFLIFAQQFLLLLVVGLGLIDVWADFRKLEKLP